MKLGESVRISWRAITGHKLRSTLTTLGIVIGVASVIAFMVFGGAFQEDAIGDVEGESEPVVIVQTQAEPEGGIGFQTVQDPIYTESDAAAIEEREGVDFVARSGGIPATQLQADGEQTLQFSVQATDSELFERDSFGHFEDGRAFQGENETVINTQVRDALDTNVSTGDQIEVTYPDGSTQSFQVSGVFNQSNADQTGPTVFLPLDPHYTVTVETPDGDQERAYPSLTVWATSVENLNSVRDSTAEYFESDGAHAPQLKQSEHSIEVQTIEGLLGQISGIFDMLTQFIVGIAALSLIVGSIGIANIMIVSVTERTREIGIMKAIGARKRDLVQLFLVEAVILGVIGATLGVLVGLGGGYLLTSLAGFPMVYPWDWVAIAVAVGIGVGVVSGIYPAWRGARVDPIEALRTE